MNEWIIYKKMLLDLPCATEYFYGKKMEEKLSFICKDNKDYSLIFPFL